jgi:hypothetical protein
VAVECFVTFCVDVYHSTSTANAQSMGQMLGHGAGFAFCAALASIARVALIVGTASSFPDSVPPENPRGDWSRDRILRNWMITIKRYGGIHQLSGLAVPLTTARQHFRKRLSPSQRGRFRISVNVFPVWVCTDQITVYRNRPLPPTPHFRPTATQSTAPDHSKIPRKPAFETSG